MSFENFMVYTTEVGGRMTAVSWVTREQYEEAAGSGRLNLSNDSDAPNWVELKMVAFAPLGELRDFVLDPVEATA